MANRGFSSKYWLKVLFRYMFFTPIFYLLAKDPTWHSSYMAQASGTKCPPSKDQDSPRKFHQRRTVSYPCAIAPIIAPTPKKAMPIANP